MSNDIQYLTNDKYNELKKELEYLKLERRKEVAEHLEYSKKLGDLSENAEYHQAREEQGKLEERISNIEFILQNSTLVKKHHGDTVSIGATVVVQKEGDKAKQTFTIVGSEEADFASGKISNNSPLGAALFGKKKGDKATFKTPKGETVYKVLSVE